MPTPVVVPAFQCVVPETAPAPLHRFLRRAKVERESVDAADYFEVRFWTVSASKSESFRVTVLSYGLSSLDIAVTK
jgi:hypothetical protein